MPSPIEVESRMPAPRGRRGRRGASGRRSHLRRVALEGLEVRALLATLPAPTHDPRQALPVQLLPQAGDEYAPSIAVDPSNPMDLAAVWERHYIPPGQPDIYDIWVVESSNGGATWRLVRHLSPDLPDPNTTNPVLPYTRLDGPQVAFDRSGDFFVLYEQDSGPADGALVLDKYSFAGGGPLIHDNVIKRWTTEGISSPTLAVDAGAATFTDPTTGAPQDDPYSGNVYVSWAGNDTAPAFITNLTLYDPNRIKVVASSDGGRTFGAEVLATAASIFGTQRFAGPSLAVSQGTIDGAVAAGQVSVGWDDFGTGATAAPVPFDILDANQLSAGTSQSFPGGSGPVADAVDPGNNQPHVPTTTAFPISVAVDPRFTTLSKATVTVDLVAADLSDIQVALEAPDGTIIQLLKSQKDAAGNSPQNAPYGATGQNLGINANGVAFGTVFDQDAVRSIVDLGPGGARGAAAPFIGHFQPDSYGTALNLNSLDGRGASQVDGTWQLLITDYRNNGTNPPPQDLVNWSLQLNSGLGRVGGDAVINSFNIVRGALAAPYPTANPAAPNTGTGPDVTLASDNTLGSFSPHQGRLYAVYVDRYDQNRDGGFAAGNPATNTDVFLKVSDDGGRTWRSPESFRGIPMPVNQDSGPQDGFSGAANPQDVLAGTARQISGRPQFEPSAAVDQTTGTLVVSFLDARYDAAQARVSTTIATSIDGGASFGPETFANAPETAFDEVTRRDVTLGPIPDNQSAGDPVKDANEFGLHQGLAVAGGHIYPAWASNGNGGFATGANNALLNHLAIAVAPMVTAAGPRVIAGTMGPVQATTVDGTTFNNTFASDGTRQVTGFTVTFDRRVDPGAFGGPPFDPTKVQVVFNAADAAPGTPPTPVAVGSVTPLDTNRFGATTFFIQLATPQSGVGTYSYSIGPNIDDRIRSVQTTTTITPGQTFNAAAPADQVNLRIPPSGTGGTGDPAQDVTRSFIQVAGVPSGLAVGHLSVNLSLTHTYDSDLIITLIGPDGTSVVLSNREGFNEHDFTNTTFDDLGTDGPIGLASAPFTGSFQPDAPLGNFVGKPIAGQWELEIDDVAAIDVGTLLGWSLSIDTGTAVTQVTARPGNPMDQNANGAAGQLAADRYQAPQPTGNATFRFPYDPQTLPLIEPGPHVVGSAVPGAPATADNLVLNGTVGAVDVTFDRDMNAASFTGADVLRIQGPTGPIAGPFDVAPSPANADPAHPRTFRISFPAQELSGTYTIQLASTITSAAGDAMDANQNAGLDLLRGSPNAGATAPVTVGSTKSETIAPGQTISSIIDVTDSFLIQALTLQLNISDPNDPDLTATLVSPPTGPNGASTSILLFGGVGATGTHADFVNTIFDDAPTGPNNQPIPPIQDGGPPFFGRFHPQVGSGPSLSALKNTLSAGNWTLRITNASTVNTGTLNGWSLAFQKPVPTNGLGELVADQTPVSFRIFTMDPTNPLSSDTWTAVGPASENNGNNSGRIGGLAVDPSDPTGNTVFVAGASGGVWKTTDFLTDDPNGPTYIPLTDFGPTFGLNTGSIAVFGRDNDPNRSIVFVATGEGDTSTTGVGVLRSTDGGATWTLLDSTTNVDSKGNVLPITSPARDHKLFGTTAFKIAVDPRPSPTGGVIVYAALSGGNGGLWRSVDSGDHWQRMRAGQATDVVLDPNSGFVNAVSNPTGNLQEVYAAFRGEGVFISPNQFQGYSLMAGGLTGDPLIQDVAISPARPIPLAGSPNPNGAQGRIVLAKPALTGNPLQDLLYEGWLYAAVAAPNDHLYGLFLTKDFGQHWTKVTLPNVAYANANAPGAVQAVPTNDTGSGASYDPLGNATFAQGNYDISLAIDPNDPNVVYLGGTSDGQPSGLLRVDTTGISDPYSFYMSNANPDGGAVLPNTQSPASLKDPTKLPLGFFGRTVTDPRTQPTINMIQDRNNPFVNGATQYASNVQQLTNNGADVRWIPFDSALSGSTDQHRVFAMKDPVTGLTRLVFGDDQGVFSAIDRGDGTLLQSIGDVSSTSQAGGDVAFAAGSRNGNLQIAQFYYGAAQPSNVAAQASAVRGMFYGSAQDDGFPSSDPNVLANGNIKWSGSTGDGGGVAVDQTGSGTVDWYKWPCCGGNITDFFTVNGVGRTFGLVQGSASGNVPDPEWPFTGVVNFAVNPLNGDQMVVSSFNSTAGPSRLYRTETAGQFWLPIADPSADPTLDGAQSLAMAFGAPDPNGPGGVGSLDNFLYFGTTAGHIYVTQTGGGPTGQQWTNISAGLLDNASVQAIVTDPTRGSHDAFAVTTDNVYYMADSTAAGAAWVPITGNLLGVMHSPFGDAGLQESQAKDLTSIAADWRYVIPDDLASPGGPTHPMLYVSGESGVYRSLDKGKTWTLFPDVALNAAPQEPSGSGQPVNADKNGGYLPSALIRDLDLSLGNVDPTTGRPDVATGPNLLVATTYGRGTFAIRLAPIVFPASLKFDPSLPPPQGSDSGTAGDGITDVAHPFIDGLGEQSAFGNQVTINLIDETPTDPTFGQVIGTGTTDPLGNLAHVVDATTVPPTLAPGVQITADLVDGPKIVGVQAVDASGTRGNIATFDFTLITAKPAAPAKLALDPASDSGLSFVPATLADNITNVTDPTFDITPSGPIPANVTEVVRLYRDGTLVATSATIPSGPILGFVKVTDPGPVTPDGTHSYTAEQVDVAGNVSAMGAPLSVTIDTQKPPAPPKPGLDPSDDTGVQGDGKTNKTRPHLVGKLTPEALEPIEYVQIVGPGGAVLGTAQAAADGTYSVQFAAKLADGVYPVRVKALDIAGNVSDPSPLFVLQINTHTPTTPTIGLDPNDNSGLQVDPNPPANTAITNVVDPHFVGRADPGVSVQLIRVDSGGNTIAVLAPATTVGADGTYSILLPSPPANLADGTYYFRARAQDAVGNLSAASPTFRLTILSHGPSRAPSLGLAPSSDTGIKGDGVTSLRRPLLTGVASPGGFVRVLTASGVPLAVAQGDPTAGVYAIQLPLDLSDGVIALRAQATDAAGNAGPLGAPFVLKIASSPDDYNSDGQSDLALYRPSDSTFVALYSGGAGGQITQFGGPNSGEVPIQGDFDGDGRTDPALYIPSTTEWILLRSQAGPTAFFFGAPGSIPVPADYDGTGSSEIASFDPATATWSIVGPGGGRAIQFGSPGDVPVPADYDHVGHAELAVFHPATATWSILGPGGGRAVQFGAPGDIPVPRDYNGDGKADLATYRPSMAAFSILFSSGGGQVAQFGPLGAVPVPDDYNGDGKADLAVYQPGTSTYSILYTGGGGQITQLDSPGDLPINAPYGYRASFGSIVAAASPGGGAIRAASLGLGRPASGPAVGPGSVTTSAPATPAPVVAAVPSGPATFATSAAAPTATTRRRAAFAPRFVNQAFGRPSPAAAQLRDLAFEAALGSLGRFRARRFPSREG